MENNNIIIQHISHTDSTEKHNLLMFWTMGVWLTQVLSSATTRDNGISPNIIVTVKL